MAFGMSAASAALVGSIAAPVVGGLLGSGGSSSSGTQTNASDPRLDPYIYGEDGILPATQDWYNKNKTGLNQQMLQGMDNQWNQANASRQGFNQMQNLGMGLMGAGVAGNPFAGGYQGGTNFTGGLNGNGGSIAPQSVSYRPAQNTQTTSPFAAQYGIDQIANAKQAEERKAAAAEKARLAAVAAPVPSSDYFNDSSN